MTMHDSNSTWTILWKTDAAVMMDVLPPPGYRMANLPFSVRAAAAVAPWTGQLLVTDIGYFPKASGHRRERPEGCGELIILACAQGHGWCRIGKQTVPVGPGMVVILPAGHVHAYGAAEADPWSLWWLYVAGRQVPVLQGANGWLSAGVFAVPGFRQVVRLIGRGLAELEHGVAPRRLSATSTIAWMILGHLQDLAVPVGGIGDPLVAQAIRIMHESLDRPHTVSGLARLVGCSPSQFAARFTAAIGHGPIDHLLRLRMERAAWLLANSSEDIATIARHLGYEDPAYFSRRFRAHHGCPPRDHRRN
jgi:AraC family transcriptional regulator, arabinose operon regulatory protein